MGRTSIQDRLGAAPREGFAETRAWWQLKFYGLAILRERGIVPARLRLVFLGDGTVLDYSPDRGELARFERSLSALWRGIQTATASGEFPARPSPLCGTCPHKVRCPAFDGTPPPFPQQLAVVGGTARLELHFLRQGIDQDLFLSQLGRQVGVGKQGVRDRIDRLDALLRFDRPDEKLARAGPLPAAAQPRPHG